MRAFLILILGAGLLNCTKQSDKQTPKMVSPFSESDSLALAEQITEENHSTTMNLIFGEPKLQIRSIGVLVYNGVNDLDVMGPTYVLGQAMGAEIQLIGTEEGSIHTVRGVEIVPDAIIDSVFQLDILVIPGGFTGTIEASYDERILSWIKMIDETSIYTAGVCTGVWILGATGLLEGKRASTNWYREEEMLAKYGAIPANERYTQDGKYWTSAGVTAGMDMSLGILQEIFGSRYSQGVMLDMEYDPAPPVEGGTPEKTNWAVRWMMNAMYDAGVEPLIDSLKNVN